MKGNSVEPARQPQPVALEQHALVARNSRAWHKARQV
jgi:hypothetical protein